MNSVLCVLCCVCLLPGLSFYTLVRGLKTLRGIELSQVQRQLSELRTEHIIDDITCVILLNFTESLQEIPENSQKTQQAEESTQPKTGGSWEKQSAQQPEVRGDCSAQKLLPALRWLFRRGRGIYRMMVVMISRNWSSMVGKEDWARRGCFRSVLGLSNQSSLFLHLGACLRSKASRSSPFTS